MNRGDDGPGGSPAGETDRNHKRQKKRSIVERRPRFAALDLGTNNCRLLIAAPRGRNFRIVDAFSRIVRLGEGLSSSGVLSEAAMNRAINAISICAAKMAQRGVTHQRCIATQACRGAANGADFLDRVTRETGLSFDVISPEEEARLAVAGCADLIDPQSRAALIFDIGGGSTELSWMKRGDRGDFSVAAWTSVPFGVVSLSEKYNGENLSDDAYEAAVADVREALAAFGDPAQLKNVFGAGGAHFLGTSGTVTSIAGVHLNLPKYRRDKVDGMWLTLDEANAVTARLHAMSHSARADEPCIGPDRADLVVCGCAILDALAREWPASRIRVADRGLREGLLADLARQSRKERRRRKRRQRKS